MQEPYEAFKENLHVLIISGKILDAIKYAMTYYGINEFEIITDKNKTDSSGATAYDSFAVGTKDGHPLLYIGEGLINAYEKLSQKMPDRLERRIEMIMLHERGHHNPWSRKEIMARQKKHGINPFSAEGVAQRESQADMYMITKCRENRKLSEVKDFLAETYWDTLYSCACYEAVEAIPAQDREDLISGYIQEYSKTYHPWLKQPFVDDVKEQVIKKYKSEWNNLPKPDWGWLQGIKPKGNSLLPGVVQNTRTHRRLLSTAKQYPWRYKNSKEPITI